MRLIELAIGIALVGLLVHFKIACIVGTRNCLIALRTDQIYRRIVVSPSGEGDKRGHCVTERTGSLRLSELLGEGCMALRYGGAAF